MVEVHYILFHFPHGMASGWFSRPLDFHGLNSWSMCTVAPRSWAQEEIKAIVILLTLDYSVKVVASWSLIFSMGLGLEILHWCHMSKTMTTNANDFFKESISGYNKGQFRLWWRSAPFGNFQGMEQYDWLQNEFFIGRGFHQGHDFSSGELQAGIVEQWHDYQHGNTFAREFSKDQVCWVTSNTRTKKWASTEFQLEAFLVIFSHLVRRTNRCLN